MMPIQQAGCEILGGDPGRLYFFCGGEYGVKREYLGHLESHYGGRIEADDAGGLFTSFEKRDLLASKRSLYVCRYDMQFLKSLDAKYASKIRRCRIPGTVVMIYADEKSFSKINKHFPDQTVRFDALPFRHTVKYLKRDFPDIPDRYISLIAGNCDGGYGQAGVVCGQLNALHGDLGRFTDDEILRTFSLHRGSTEDQFKIAVASRGFASCLGIIRSFDGDKNFLLNCMCIAMLDLDKLLDNGKGDSPLSKHVGKWTRRDVCNFFADCSCMMSYIRSSSYSFDVEYALIWLASLLRFKTIPAPGDVFCGS